MRKVSVMPRNPLVRAAAAARRVAAAAASAIRERRLIDPKKIAARFDRIAAVLSRALSRKDKK